MTRIVTVAAAVSVVAVLLSAKACGRGEERSEAAREALKAVDELRATVDEFESMGARYKELNDKLIWQPQRDPNAPPATDAEKAEFQALSTKLSGVKERASRLLANLMPDLNRKIEANAKDAGLFDARSRCHETLGDFDEALKDIDAGLAIVPKDTALRVRRPGILRKLGRYEESRAACAELLKTESTHPVALATDGLCLYALNEFSQSMAKLAEATANIGRLEPSLAREVKQFSELAARKRGEWDEELQKRAAEAKADDLPRVKLKTSRGDIVVELFENEAPNTVANFIVLCEKKFYDGTKFHRVIPDFMVQGGDPLSRDANPENDGQGGPGYKFDDELPPGHRKHFRGVLSMANGGPSTNGCQFFLTHRPTEHLDGKHTVFGRVVEGMAIVDAIRKSDELKETEILRKRGHEYRPVY